MAFIDQVRDLAERAIDLKDGLETEEATKNALVMPFISMLGYDVFNPREVVPEFTADTGVKKGEKVDYAILSDGIPTILVECKASDVKLEEIHKSQLSRYFSVTTPAKFGILTNGVEYQFYSDLDATNLMDSKPFLEFNLLDVRESLVAELEKFTKSEFDVENILDTASQLKHTHQIKQLLANEYENPSDELVRLWASEVYDGRMTQSVRDQFEQLIKKAFRQFINDKIQERLRPALDDSSLATESAPETPSEDVDQESVVTTEDELRAFYVVKAILHGTVDPSRIAMRDVRTYCGILLDDNNRKPICRLHFNRSQKYIGLFDGEKNETRHRLESIEEIYDWGEQLKEAAVRIEGTSPSSDESAGPE